LIVSPCTAKVVRAMMSKQVKSDLLFIVFLNFYTLIELLEFKFKIRVIKKRITSKIILKNLDSSSCKSSDKKK
jgi:hypothetical protein